MKVLYMCAIFAALAFAVVQADVNDDAHNVTPDCHQEAKSSPEEAAKFFGGGMKEADVSDALKCHFKCIMTRLGHLKNGILDEQAVIKSFENFPGLQDKKEDLTQAVSECKATKGANECDTAFKLMMCLRAHKVGDIIFQEHVKEN